MAYKKTRRRKKQGNPFELYFGPVMILIGLGLLWYVFFGGQMM